MKISDSILYVGVNDRATDLFEGQYRVPEGMSYNSYIIIDEKIAVMDTVDAHFGAEWLANIRAAPTISSFTTWNPTTPPTSRPLCPFTRKPPW